MKIENKKNILHIFYFFIFEQSFGGFSERRNEIQEKIGRSKQIKCNATYLLYDSIMKNYLQITLRIPFILY